MGSYGFLFENAIALTLENNLDIDVARFQIPIAQADYLRTKSGQAARGVTGATISSALFAGALGRRVRPVEQVDQAAAQAVQASPAVAP